MSTIGESVREESVAAGGADRLFELTPLPGACFGATMRFPALSGAREAVATLEAEPETLGAEICARGGFLLIPEMHQISDDPETLLRLSRLLGPEVEDYRNSYAFVNRRNLFNFHDTVPEIIQITNMPPIGTQPSPLPDPPLTEDGRIPVQHPHRTGWHTDQSFRRPPPDYSLFYAKQPVPQGQGQTLFADSTRAYAELPDAMKARVEGLEGIHVLPGMGRSDKAVRQGEAPRPLAAHQQPQRQPLVRVHPVTGTRSLYMCGGGQMDFLTGPIAGMEPGPDGDGAALLYELLHHLTQRRFTYTHEWAEGDLVIYDNRNLLHAGTWYDVDAHIRVMWRTTVRGNPDPTYDGEDYSWVPAEDFKPS